jgi:hypothetical protein
MYPTMASWQIRPCLDKERAREVSSHDAAKSEASILYISYLLKLRLAEVVHGKVVRDTEGIESNIVTNVSLQVCRVRKERNSRALLRVQGGGLGS